MIISIGLTNILIPYCNAIMQIELPYYLLTTKFQFVFTCLLLIGITAISAVFTTRKILKVNGLISSQKNSGDQKKYNYSALLTILQFITSIVLVAFLISMKLQINFIYNQDLGFAKEQILYVKIPKMSVAAFIPFESKLRQNPDIEAISTSNRIPGDVPSRRSCQILLNGERKSVSHNIVFINSDFLDVYDLEVTVGEGMSRYLSYGKTYFLLNESALRKWGINDYRKIRYAEKNVEIKGVIKDINFRSLHHKVEPFIFAYTPGKVQDCISIRFREGSDIPKLTEFLQKTWNDINGDFILDIRFLELALQEQYYEEEQLITIFKYLSIVAILLTISGIVCLMSFSTAKRKKEIGLRKINGANAKDISFLFIKEFVVLYLISVALAFPIFIFSINEWLRNYTYKAVVFWWIFPLSVLVIFFIAFISVVYNVWKSTTTNPIEVIKHD